MYAKWHQHQLAYNLFCVKRKIDGKAKKKIKASNGACTTIVRIHLWGYKRKLPTSK